MVAAKFNCALEALLHHDSVRASLRAKIEKAALTQHSDAGSLCGAFWDEALRCWQAYITHHGRRLHLGYFQHEEHAAKVRDLMAIKLHGMHTPLNFVPETYNDIYRLMAMVDQALLIELLWAFSRIRNKLLAELARQHKRMTCEAGSEAMAMGDDVATRFDSALDVVLRHDSVRAPYNLNRRKSGSRHHNDAGGLCGAAWCKDRRRWMAQVTWSHITARFLPA
ncbi:hypothetical protein V8C86DRAFT_971184 [Haematococcus lacustris]